ncbi:MAG TPA: hypothetical protein VN048_03235 [Verrucomicrobiae bacterium]|nr:hypothetical protein [Verrucomicrobiae bacterium]
MAANDKITEPVSSARRLARRLRITAVVVLLSGMIAGLAVYWTGTPPADLSDDVATADTSKIVQRDIEMNAGKMGLSMSDLLDDWQYPGTRAAVLLMTAVLVAGGCFYFARLLDRDDGESPDKTDSHPG